MYCIYGNYRKLISIKSKVAQVMNQSTTWRSPSAIIGTSVNSNALFFMHLCFIKTINNSQFWAKEVCIWDDLRISVESMEQCFLELLTNMRNYSNMPKAQVFFQEIIIKTLDNVHFYALLLKIVSYLDLVLSKRFL